MYEKFYSFSAMPFQLTPDVRFYFGSKEHRKAMSFLEYGIAQREGFVVITGEIGAGKTTLVEQLLATIDPQHYVIAKIVTTQLSGFDALCMIGAAFNLYRDGMSKSALITRFTEFFSNLSVQGKYPLIIVDEAQSLTADAIEELRMLSNLVVGTNAPFQGILLGQPEFRAVLSHPDLQQFRQRVIASCHLGALTSEDTRKYVEYRLGRVGWAGDPSFSDGAFGEIHRNTGGIPRRINTLCSRLLLLGYLDETHAIDESQVAAVAEEMRGELGMMQTSLTWTGDRSAESRAPGGRVEVLHRLNRLERTTETHDRTINRVLELALKLLPAGD